MNDFINVLVGGVGGGLVSLFGQILLEGRRRKHDFFLSRRVAMQNCVHLIDIISGYKKGGADESELKKRWYDVCKHLGEGAAFFPTDMQKDVTELSRAVVFKQSPSDVEISKTAMESLRKNCVDALAGYGGNGWSLRRWFRELTQS